MGVVVDGCPPRLPLEVAEIQRDLQGIAGCLALARFDDVDEQAERELLECLFTDGVESQTLSRAAANIISARYDLEGDASTRSLARWHQKFASIRSAPALSAAAGSRNGAAMVTTPSSRA